MDMECAESEKTTTCPVCGKEAAVHCVECNKDLCQECHTYHDAFIKDHHVVAIEEVKSGKITTEDRVCKIHGELVRYYCETEDKLVCTDCVSLKTCSVEHEKMTLKEIADRQVKLITGLQQQFADNKKKFEDAIADTDAILDKLNKSVECTKSEAVKCKEQYIDQVNQGFDEQVDKIEQIHKDRVKVIESKKKDLKSEVDKMKEAEKQVSDFIALNSGFLVTYNYSSLSNTLNELSLEKPIAVDESLGYLAYESIPKMVPPTAGHLWQRERWTPIEQFPLSGMKKPNGIALNHDGDIAVTSSENGVKVFSRDGQVKCSFMDDYTQILAVTVSHDNRFIVESGKTYEGLKFYTNEGKIVSCMNVSDTSNEKSCIQSVAIDTNDRIIVGLLNNTISIHYADGSLISKFATKYRPFCLAATSEGDIVCSHYDTNPVEIIDYSGSIVSVLQPPPGVNRWVPEYVCSGRGEIFIANQRPGDPTGIYRYTSKGQYLGCVTTEVKNPRGIALSQDGMELFVIDRDVCQVQIYKRE